MVLGRNRVEPSSSQSLLQRGRRRNNPIVSTSPAPVHKSSSVHALGPVGQTGLLLNGIIPRNGFLPQRANSVSPAKVPNGQIPSPIPPGVATIPEDFSRDQFEDPTEDQCASKSENSSEKSNGTLLSAATLDVVTTAPRRVGPLFPDTLSTSTKGTGTGITHWPSSLIVVLFIV